MNTIDDLHSSKRHGLFCLTHSAPWFCIQAFPQSLVVPPFENMLDYFCVKACIRRGKRIE